MKKYPVRLMFFSGFYESIHNSALESEEEYIMEDYPGKKWDDFHWTYDWESYAKKYVSAISSETGLDFKFRNLWSPREYNFATDEIYCYLSSKDVKKISSAIKSETMERLVTERFTSRDGFLSFYSQFLGEWIEKKVTDWDEIELGTLLDAWLMENNLYEGLDYEGYDYCSGNGQYVDCVETEDSKLRTEEALQLSKENVELKILHEKELEKLEAWKSSVAGW
jgi:hypothetical protein